jgi:CheY-like chemotaxis protein
MGQKLLVVDDSRTVCQAVKYAFAASAWSVDAVHSAQEAMRALRTGAYEAALIDYMLPDGPGLQLLRLIRTEASLVRLPVVFLTGAFHPISLDEAMGAGADLTLTKPFKTDDLHDAVNRAIAQAPSRPLSVPRATTPPPAPAPAAPAAPPAPPAAAMARKPADDDDDFNIIASDDAPAAAPAPTTGPSPLRPPVTPAQPAPLAGGFRRVPPPPAPEPARRMPLAPPPPAPLRGTGAGALAPPPPPALAGAGRRPLADTTETDTSADAPVQEAAVFRHASSASRLTPTTEEPPAMQRPDSGTPLHGLDAVSAPEPAPFVSVAEEPPAAELAPEPEPVVEAAPTDSALPPAVPPVQDSTYDEDFEPADPAPAEPVAAAPAAPASLANVSAEAVRAAIAAELDTEAVRAIVRELLPGIVKEYLGVMLRQTGQKLESYSNQKIDSFVERDLPRLAQEAIDRYLTSLDQG